MNRARSGISIGTIIFWIAIGWFWFGDTITSVFNKTVEVTVNEEKVAVNIDKTVEQIKTVINDFKETAEKEIAKKKRVKEENPNTNEDKVVVDEKNTENNFSHDDRYGDSDEKW